MEFFDRLKKLLRFILLTLISISTLILISGIPYLVNATGGSWAAYLKGLQYTALSMFHPDEMIFINQGNPGLLFPYIWEPLGNTFFLLSSSFAISVVLAVGLSLLIQSLPEALKKVAVDVVSLTQSLPDIFIVVIFQFLIIWWYQRTGILLASVASTSQNTALLLPLVSLCILPTALIIKMLLLNFADEKNQLYTEFAASKGLSKFHILFHHVLRNTLFSLFTHSRTIIWAILSNVLMVEYLFNIHGMTRFLVEYANPEIFNFILIMLFLPLLFLFKFLKIWISKVTGETV